MQKKIINRVLILLSLIVYSPVLFMRLGNYGTLPIILNTSAALLMIYPTISEYQSKKRGALLFNEALLCCFCANVMVGLNSPFLGVPFAAISCTCAVLWLLNFSKYQFKQNT